MRTIADMTRLYSSWWRPLVVGAALIAGGAVLFAAATGRPFTPAMLACLGLRVLAGSALRQSPLARRIAAPLSYPLLAAGAVAAVAGIAAAVAGDPWLGASASVSAVALALAADAALDARRMNRGRAALRP
jgi:hypothetical protein